MLRESERRDRITIPRGSIITLSGFILSLNAPPPSPFVSDAPVKIYIVKHFSRFWYMTLFWKLDLRRNAQFLLTIITYVLQILHKYTDESKGSKNVL